MRRASALPMPGMRFNSLVSARFRSTTVPAGYLDGAGSGEMPAAAQSGCASGRRVSADARRT